MAEGRLADGGHRVQSARVTEGNVDPPAEPAIGPPRRSLLRRLLGESAVYGLGGVANQALAIVLVPIYARQLGLENYGVVAILTTTGVTVDARSRRSPSPTRSSESYLNETRDERVPGRGAANDARPAADRFAPGTCRSPGPLASRWRMLLLGSPDAWLLMALIGTDRLLRHDQPRAALLPACRATTARLRRHLSSVALCSGAS